MKKKKRKIRPEIIAVLIGLILLTIALIYPLQSASIRCEVRGLEYWKLENVSCWNPQFSDDYCPMPTDLECDISVKYSALHLMMLV